jgi:hypothetical protein
VRERTARIAVPFLRHSVSESDVRLQLPLTLSLAALAAITACAPSVTVSRDPSAPIAPGSSWAWGAPDGDGLAPEEGALLPTDTAHQLFTAAIESELIAKGFPRVRGDSAALVVHYHIGRRTVQDTLPAVNVPQRDGGAITAPGSWGGYGRPESVDDRTVEWEEGMLIVDVISRAQRVVAWRGAIMGEIPEAAGADPGPAIRAAVRRLLREFP